MRLARTGPRVGGAMNLLRQCAVMDAGTSGSLSLDLNPEGSINDNGCGGESVVGSLGADVKTDVVVK